MASYSELSQAPHGPILYSLLVLFGLLFIKYLILISFFWLPYLDWQKQNEKIHGKTKDDKTNKVLVVIFGPLIEELIFRGPILFFLLFKDSIIYPIIIAVLSTFLFGVAHVDKKIEYTDGTKKNIPKAAITNITIGGMIYSFSVILTASLWPSIILHSVWNSSDYFIKESFMTKLAKMIQKPKILTYEPLI